MSGIVRRSIVNKYQTEFGICLRKNAFNAFCNVFLYFVDGYYYTNEPLLHFISFIILANYRLETKWISLSILYECR